MRGKETAETILATKGRNPARDSGSVNPPVHRTSTVLFPDYETFRDYNAGKNSFRSYGRFGSPTTDGLEEIMIALEEGAEYAITTGCGLSAITTCLLGFLSAGDHALFPDSIYGSARNFIDVELVRLGIEVQYYDPTIGAAIVQLVKPNTKVVYCESPGSLTFEMQDIPAIAKVAHARGALVMVDATWSTPLLQKSFALGADIVIHSASKYIGGHSDLVMGIVLTTNTYAKRLKQIFRNLGTSTSPDDTFLALRGLRTMEVRLKQHEKNAFAIARWLQKRREVKRVLFPALPEDPGHAIWKRDMTGASGLLAFELGVVPDAAIGAFVNGLTHFGLGYSWGGYESLITVYEPAKSRTVTTFEPGSIYVRLHIGIESPQDLIEDLEAAFTRFGKAK